MSRMAGRQRRADNRRRSRCAPFHEAIRDRGAGDVRSRVILTVGPDTDRNPCTSRDPPHEAGSANIARSPGGTSHQIGGRHALGSGVRRKLDNCSDLRRHLGGRVRPWPERLRVTGSTASVHAYLIEAGFAQSSRNRLIAYDARRTKAGNRGSKGRVGRALAKDMADRVRTRPGRQAPKVAIVPPRTAGLPIEKINDQKILFERRIVGDQPASRCP